VANSQVNPDLFWALRGGGGSTYGVITKATVKVYPSPKMAFTEWVFHAADKPAKQGFYDSVAYFYSLIPSLSAQGIQGYFYVNATTFTSQLFTSGSNASIEAAHALWSPIWDKIATFEGATKPTSHHYLRTSFKDYFDQNFGSSDGTVKPNTADSMFAGESGYGTATIPSESGGSMAGGSGMSGMPSGSDKTTKRANPLASLKQDFSMDSRLIGAEQFQNPTFASVIKASVSKLPGAILMNHLVSGPKAWAASGANETSACPAWKKAYVHVIGIGSSINPIRAISKDMGAYANEASPYEEEWKETFWGSNYPRLAAIKDKYDPNGVFWASPGVGADKWVVKSGRLCRSNVLSNERPPSSDN
jgi:Berberine and berberine like